VRGWWSIRFVALLAAALTGVQAKAADPGRLRIPTKAELELCPKLAPVDWKTVRRRVEKADLASPAAPAADPLAEHRRIRGPRPLPDLGRAEIVLDVAIGPGETQEYPTSTSSFVWKEPGGAWQLNRVDQTSAPPSPLPPGWGVAMDAAWNEAAQRPLTEGPLGADQAQALDRLLADPCFAAQPDVMPWDLPMKHGPDEVCSGLIGGTVRMRTSAGVRYLSDPCGRGYGFEASRLVMYAQLDRAAWVGRALAKALDRDDLALTGLKSGKSGTVAELICGSVSAPGQASMRFIWKLYMRGPYAEEELVFERDAQRAGIADFEQYWQARCGG
jgi:hypothetical protein